MTATFSSFYYRVLSCRPRGGLGGEGGRLPHLRNLSPSNQIHDKYSMTHGLMGNNGLCFPELDGRGAWRSNVIQILKPKRSLHQHPLGIHPLISKTVDASVSKWSPQHTPLLTGKSCKTNPNSHTRRESGRRGGVMLWKQIVFKMCNTLMFWPHQCNLVALFVCLLCLRVKG